MHRLSRLRRTVTFAVAPRIALLLAAAMPGSMVRGQHSGDYEPSPADWKIDQAELDRVTFLYNTRYTPPGTSRTGAYAPDAATPTAHPDGFVPDPSRPSSQVVTLARYHSADTDRNGKINLFELTRVVELYNYNNSGTGRTGEYHAQPGTEDGFAAGAAASTPPSFQGTLADQTVPAGSTVTFAITVNGGAPITFQWRKDGVAIVGATTPTLTLAAAQPIDSGNYSVVITNAAGTALSNAARLVATIPTVYRITAAHSGKVLTVAGGSIELGAAVEQWDYSGSPSQLWMLPHIGGQTYAIENVNSGHVLDIRDWPVVDFNGVRLQQWWKHGAEDDGQSIPTVANERWSLQPAGNAEYYFTSTANNRVVTIEGSATANAAPAVQWDNVAGSNQRFYFTIVPYTWSTPAFDPGLWNDDDFVRENNNCYNYANNRRTDSFAQPGRASGFLNGFAITDTAWVALVNEGCLRDGLVGTTATEPAPLGKTRVIAYWGTFDFQNVTYWDYHFWRQDVNGRWSHKPGRTAARNVDASDQEISNPETADRGFYNTPIGYYFTASDAIQGRGHANVR